MIKSPKASATHSEQVITSFQTAQGTPRWQGWVPFFKLQYRENEDIHTVKLLHYNPSTCNLNPLFISALILFCGRHKDPWVMLYTNRALFWWVLTQAVEDSLIHGETRLGANPSPEECNCIWLRDTLTLKDFQYSNQLLVMYYSRIFGCIFLAKHWQQAMFVPENIKVITDGWQKIFPFPKSMVKVRIW